MINQLETKRSTLYTLITFEEVEESLNVALNTMKEYYNDNYLKPNPAKIQITAFHLQNKDAKRKLRINW
jgi:hypothetical protein